MAFKYLLLSLLLASTLASAYTSSRNPQAQSINWGPCNPNVTKKIAAEVDCGTLGVPLDYTVGSSTNNILQLDLVKVNATKQPPKGSILFNPGGPGKNGHDLVLSGRKAFSVVTGGDYDLIGFDPRGTGTTLPVSCYSDTTTRAIWRSKYSRGALLPGPSDTTIEDLLAEYQILAELCHNSMGENGTLVGTAFVARDMMQIVDALPHGPLLNYWGLSYGTTLGATVAALFPDRMGKLVLDGVVNSHEYYNGLQYSASVDTDAVFQGFVSSCVAAPHQCPLARSDSTNGSVTNEILNFLEGLKNNSEVSEPQRSIYAPVKLLITSNLKAPLKWPILATALHQILTGDSQAFKATASQLDEGSPIFPSNSNASEAQAAIECSDLTQRINDAQKIEQLSEAFEEQSFWGGGYGGLYLALCAHWRFTAKETYLGDFQVRTKNPILFIGNTYDPITPLVSAQNMSTGFEGSVVLEQHSYGHTSLSQPSLCTAKVIQTYFQTGELPPKGKKCEPEFAPFKSNATFVDIFANATELNKRASRQTKMTEGRYLVL